MFKTAALNNVGNAYVDKDDSTSTPGTRLEADDRNIIQQEFVNVVERSGQTLDAAGTFTNNDQLSQAFVREIPFRSQFSWTSTTQIGLAGGSYPHWGTTTQILKLDSAITHTITVPGVSVIQYIYIDDSAIVTAGTNDISASEIVNSTTEPTYDPDKNGWYNAFDLCIFAVKIDSSGNVEPFDHRNNAVRVGFDDNVITGGSTPGASWTTLTMSTPSFCIKGKVYAGITDADVQVVLMWRAYDGGDTAGWVAMKSEISETVVNEFEIITDFFQKFEVTFAVATTAEVTMSQVEWEFPRGM